MLELLATSFPVIIRYYYLKRIGAEITVWNMKTAVFLWLFLAFGLFTTIFYYHPKSYSGLLPFRTVSVVAQTGGPVIEILVKNGQAVSTGDVLFRIEDNTQTAALAQAKAEFDKIDAEESKAKESLKLAEATVEEAKITLNQQKTDLTNAETLLKKAVITEDKVRKLRSSVQIAEAEIVSAEAQLAIAQTDISATLPAQRNVAEAAYNSAKVELEKTEVKAFSNGVVAQLALGVGSPASRLILSPAMVIIPDRPEGVPERVVAGFSQVSRDVLHVGMPAEIACDANTNLAFVNSVLPAKVAAIQPAIAAGQIVPSGNLLELNQVAARGSVLVFFEFLHKEHEDVMLDGSGCMVQTYTNTLSGTVGHIIAATGVVKAVGLRLKIWGVLLSGIGLAGGGGH